MKYQKSFLMLHIVALVFGFMTVGTIEAQTNSRLEGTWFMTNDRGTVIERKFNNGVYEQFVGGNPSLRGTYTTSGNNFNIRLTRAHGNTVGNGLSDRWYTYEELDRLNLWDWVHIHWDNWEYGIYSISGNTLSLTFAPDDESGERFSGTITYTRR